MEIQEHILVELSDIILVKILEKLLVMDAGVQVQLDLKAEEYLVIVQEIHWEKQLH